MDQCLFCFLRLHDLQTLGCCAHAGPAAEAAADEGAGWNLPVAASETCGSSRSDVRILIHECLLQRGDGFSGAAAHVPQSESNGLPNLEVVVLVAEDLDQRLDSIPSVAAQVRESFRDGSPDIVISLSVPQDASEDRFRG